MPLVEPELNNIMASPGLLGRKLLKSASREAFFKLSSLNQFGMCLLSINRAAALHSFHIYCWVQVNQKPRLSLRHITIFETENLCTTKLSGGAMAMQLTPVL